MVMDLGEKINEIEDDFWILSIWLNFLYWRKSHWEAERLRDKTAFISSLRCRPETKLQIGLVKHTWDAHNILKKAVNIYFIRKQCGWINYIKFIKHVLHRNLVGGSSMIVFPLVIAVSERDMPGIKPGPLGRHTRTLTNELQEVRQ